MPNAWFWATIPPSDPYATKYWTGTVWQSCAVNYWNSSAWAPARVHLWTGTEWN